MKPTLALALQPSVVKRALKYAVMVGAILLAISHGDALLRGDLPTTRLFRMALTVLVPYVVSTLSSVGAMWEAGNKPPLQDVPTTTSNSLPKTLPRNTRAARAKPSPVTSSRRGCWTGTREYVRILPLLRKPVA